MWLAILLALCCLTSDTHGAHPTEDLQQAADKRLQMMLPCRPGSSQSGSYHLRFSDRSLISKKDLPVHPRDCCSKDLNSSVKPGFPQTINTNNPGVLKAARHSVEKFNNSTNDIFLFKESCVSKALVQVVKGLKYMLEVEIGRTTCRKTTHHQLDNCDFQTNPALKRTLHCYSEVWVIPWLQSFEVPVLRCLTSVSSARLQL